MKRLILRSGDRVTISKHSRNGNSKLYTYEVIKPGKITPLDLRNDRYLNFNSTLHRYMENVGINPTHKQRETALARFPRNQRKYFRNIEVLEIERKKKWYTSILNKLRSLIRKK